MGKKEPEIIIKKISEFYEKVFQGDINESDIIGYAKDLEFKLPENMDSISIEDINKQLSEKIEADPMLMDTFKEYLKTNIEHQKEMENQGNKDANKCKSVNHELKEIIGFFEKQENIMYFLDKFNVYGLQGSLLVLLVDKIQDMNFLKEFIQREGLTSIEVNAWITHNQELSRFLLKDENRLERFKAVEPSMILSLDDPEEIKTFLTAENIKKYNIPVDIQIYIALKTKDETIINKYLDSYERNSEGLGSELNNIAQRNWYTKRVLDLAVRIKNGEYNVTKDEIERYLILPEEMTMGVEMETVGNYSLTFLDMKSFLGWDCKDDGSLGMFGKREGVEVVSPVLRKETNPTEQIFTVFKTLKENGQGISERCGGHIHLGANYLTDDENYKVYSELITSLEPALYLAGNKSGEIPRPGICTYAQPITPLFESKIDEKDGTVDLHEEDDIKGALRKLQDPVRKSRTCKI